MGQGGNYFKAVVASKLPVTFMADKEENLGSFGFILENEMMESLLLFL